VLIRIICKGVGTGELVERLAVGRAVGRAGGSRLCFVATAPASKP
jgi:hypothetical protein